MRRVEVGDEDAVDLVARGAGPARVADFDDIATRRGAMPSFSAWSSRFAERRRRPKGVGQHLEALVARGHRPVGAELDQRVGLTVLVLVVAGRALDVVDDDQRPVVGGDVLQAGEGVDGGVDLPERREVLMDLLGERRGDAGQVRDGDVDLVGDEGDVDGQAHGFFLLSSGAGYPPPRRGVHETRIQCAPKVAERNPIRA